METMEKPASLQGFVDRWLEAQPMQHVALLFVDGRRHAGHLALAALEQELLDACYGAREPQVVVGKLRWWIGELVGAPDTGGQHPVTQVLFADERALTIPMTTWTAPVHAAIEQIEQGTAADFDAQLAAARPLHAALATLETAWWYGMEANPMRATQAAILGHLLHALRRLPQDIDRDCLPLPMARLAQHGLGREALRESSPARTQAVKAQLRDLLRVWRALRGEPGPLGVFRAVESRYGYGLVRRALVARDPLAVLAADVAHPGFLSTLHAWRAAMAWQRALAATPRTVAAHRVVPG